MQCSYSSDQNSYNACRQSVQAQAQSYARDVEMDVLAQCLSKCP